jgi:hypothetical protein
MSRADVEELWLFVIYSEGKLSDRHYHAKELIGGKYHDLQQLHFHFGSSTPPQFPKSKQNSS